MSLASIMPLLANMAGSASGAASGVQGSGGQQSIPGQEAMGTVAGGQDQLSQLMASLATPQERSVLPEKGWQQGEQGQEQFPTSIDMSGMDGMGSPMDNMQPVSQPMSYQGGQPSMGGGQEAGGSPTFMNLMGTAQTPNMFNRMSQGYTSGGLLGALGMLLTDANSMNNQQR